MTTLREAAQQALEALQAHGSHAPNCDYLVLLTSLPPQRKPCSCGLGANITALRAALAEPEQRPISDVTEAVTKTVIEVEKLLCGKIGRQWQPSCMSIRTLVDELAALVAAEKDQEIERLREALKESVELIETLWPLEGATVRKARRALQEQPR